SLLLSPVAGYAQALPSGGTVTHGEATISQSGSSLLVTQSSHTAILNWNSFSIGGGASAHFENGSGATLNRVTGNLPSAIDGTLTATGCYRPLSDPDHRPGLFPADWRHRAMALSRCPQTCRAPARRLGF